MSPGSRSAAARTTRRDASKGRAAAGGTGGGLFDAAAERRLANGGPLAARMRPHSLDDVVGQRHLVAPGAPLRVLIEQDRITSAILWGPPGSGKTTLAAVVADHTSKAFVRLSAVSAGVADVRLAMEDARLRLGEHGQGTILFIDEVHRFNRAQQDALLPAVEEGLIVLIGATTENPFFAVNSPLLSRATLWRLEPLDEDDLRELVNRALQHERATATDEAVSAIVALAEGDARAALGTLEVALALAADEPREEDPQRVEHRRDELPGVARREDERPGVARREDEPLRDIHLEDIERARAGRLLHQDPDAHYDQASAMIKSIRGSDVDAGLYWLARMLEGGEDPRFIARRLVILASEDVGMADPMGLVVADAAARAVEFVGLPEAQLNLAHAVVYLAAAPKSNRVTAAIGRARQDVREGRPAQVPAHLRDAHYRGASTLGHGEGYRYPHDDPRGWVEQEYLPSSVVGHRYYEPSDHGSEREVAERLRLLGEGDPRGRGQR